jgi:tetratricopeptide (TPR) repeat protein
MKIITLIALTLSASVPLLQAADYGTRAGQSLNLPVNGRAGGLAGNYSAMAGDASAVSFNPAGLGLVQSFGLVLMHQMSGDVNYEYAAGSFPLPIGTLGLDFGYVGVRSFKEFVAGYDTGLSLSYGDYYVGGSFARELFNVVSLGAGVKYFQSSFGNKATADHYASASTVLFDAGLLAGFNVLNFDKDSDKNLRIGVSALNLGGKLRYLQTAHAVGASYRAGLFYQPVKYANVLADYVMTEGMPSSFGAGLEIMPEWILSLRTGVRLEDSRLLVAGGLGLQYQIGTVKFGFDYAINSDPERGLLHWFTLNLQKFSASLSDFTIAGIRIIDIFPGMYKYYTKSKVTTVDIKNNTTVPIEKVKVTFFVKDYMDFPSESDTIPVIRPKSSVKVDLPASFNNKVLSISEDTPAQAQIKVEYFAEGKQQQLSQTKNFKMYNRNAMTWDVIAKLASFTTPKDPPVKTFARGLIQSFADVDLKGVNEKLAAAALYFDALGRYGMTYVLDPQSPLRKRDQTLESVDYIQFPRDCLRFKTGDCDDLTVLFCALLQNIGVNTALVDLQDHIMMMFDTEVKEEDKFMIAADDNKMIIRNGTVWIPVETTMYGKSFIDAWNFALQEYAAGERENRATVVDIMKAWEDFPPVTLEQSPWDPALPDKQGLLGPFSQDLNTILTYGIDSQLNQLENRIGQNPSDVAALNKAGILYAYKDNFDRAVALLNQAVQAQPNGAKAFNNLGNVYMLKEDYKSAEAAYLKAVQLNPTNPGYYINLAILYNKTGNEKKALEMSEKAEKLMK